MFDGFANRVEFDLKQKPYGNIKVRAPAERKYSVWIGKCLPNATVAFNFLFCQRWIYYG